MTTLVYVTGITYQGTGTEHKGCYKGTVFRMLVIPVHYSRVRQWHAITLPRARDNVNMFSGQKWWIIASCLYSLRLLHLDTKALTFSVFFLVT